MAKTFAGKQLEKYLQSKVNEVFTLQATISVGEYEGTLDMVDVDKLRKKLNNKTKDLDEMKKTIDSYETTIEVADFTIATQEGLSVVGPGAPNATALLVREKAKEQADDLKEVVKDQGKSAIKMVLDGLKNARETLNTIGDDMQKSLQREETT